jgi:hypothetical protein
MGGKAGVLIYVPHKKDVANTVRASSLDPEKATRLATQIYTARGLKPVTDGREAQVWIGSGKDWDVVLDPALLENDQPSQAITSAMLGASNGRRLILLSFYIVVDWFACAVWENEQLVRSISISSGGIHEDIGERLESEIPYWNCLYPPDF